jgi:hypothetical protein
VWSVDVTNPAAPVRLGHLVLPGSTMPVAGVSIQGLLAYASGRNAGAAVIDISDPAAMRVVGTQLLDGENYSVVPARDGLLYAVGEYSAVKLEVPEGLQILRYRGLTPYRDDRFSTGAISDGTTPGWIGFGMNDAQLGWPTYHSPSQTYRMNISANPAGTHFRTAGVLSPYADWLPYSVVGPSQVVRAKFMVWAGGMANPADQNQMPNMRLRLSNRFAVNSMLEVFNHEPGDTLAIRQMYAELRPSTLSSSPSVYTVDFDPVDVPHLANNAATEGILRGFEAYAIHSTDRGYLAMTESIIGTYPLASTPIATTPTKTYAPDAGGAGDLALFVPDAELSLSKLIPGAAEGLFPTADNTAPLPTHSANVLGVTVSTAAVGTDRIGIATRDINPDRNTNAYASRVRAAEDKLYQVRFHLTSTQQTNRQAQVRLRARTIKFGWSQKFEIGGAWATGGGTYPLNENNTIAQQALPGVGCQNPDKNASESGGWYTLVMNTPMARRVRADFSPTTPLATSMPNISAQPGPGESSTSRRDIFVGMDLIDSLSGGAGRNLEQGVVTLDRIEVRVHDSPVD